MYQSVLPKPVVERVFYEFRGYSREVFVHKIRLIFRKDLPGWKLHVVNSSEKPSSWDQSRKLWVYKR